MGEKESQNWVAVTVVAVVAVVLSVVYREIGFVHLVVITFYRAKALLLYKEPHG